MRPKYGIMPRRRRVMWTPCQSDAVSRRRRANTTPHIFHANRANTAPSQHDVMSGRCHANSISCPENIVPNRDRANISFYKIQRPVKMVSCQGDAVPNGAVSARRLVNTTLCQHEVLSTRRRAKTMSCEHRAVSMRHRVKASSRYDAVQRLCRPKIYI